MIREGWVKPAMFYMLPETVGKLAFNLLSPSDTRLRRAGHTFWVEDDNTRMYLTGVQDAIRFYDASPTSRITDVRDKYEMRGFCEIEPGDDVVDVGAFIGEFSKAAAHTGNQVYAIEPDSRSYKIAKRNLARYRNVLVTNTLITHENALTNYNLAVDGSESSLSTPDYGPSRRTLEMMGIRLDEWGSNIDIGFLKIDVEGHEAAVLRGLGDLRPDKISVDCSEPDVDGKSPINQVEHELRTRGYDTKRDDERAHVYARL
jgi:FkbM family methyltransferase